jgi:hypothetical protein
MTGEMLMTKKTYMTEEEILALSPDAFRALTPDEDLHDKSRRMFQMMGLIYQNQIDIKNRLDGKAGSVSG